MLISGLLVLVSLAAFLWQAGLLEWRGTDGVTTLDITLICHDARHKVISLVSFLDFEESQIELDLSSKDKSLAAVCSQTRIQTNRMPLKLVSAGIPDAPGDDSDIAAHFVPIKFGDAEPFLEANIGTVERLRFDYGQDDLESFVGLGERDTAFKVSISSTEKIGEGQGSYDRGTLQVRPPEDFHIDTSVPPATVSENDIWNIDLKKYDQLVEITFKDNRLSRLDHVVDSSIAALLGVGAGGVMSAWLALRIRRNRSESVHIQLRFSL